MTVTTKHPDYTAIRAAEWQLTRDCLSGEGVVKSKGATYLPRPGAFNNDDVGASLWAAYQLRAQFPEILAPTVSALNGIAHAREVQIELPDALQYLWEDADGNGTPLEELHRSITRELLTVGRYGLLADIKEGDVDPVLVGYAGETIINWDRGFAVLDESGNVRDGFKWEAVERYRVLRVEDGRYVSETYNAKGEGLKVALTNALGGKPVPEIPLAVANSLRLSFGLAPPPLIGVSRAAIAIYQLSADYRWQLYNTGVETLVAKNCAAPDATGPGAIVEIQGGGEVDVDLFYVSPSCKGIEANRTAIEENRTAAVLAGAKLLEKSEAAQESGTARELRMKAETATLQTIVQSSCALLEKALRYCAVFKGLDPKTVIVTPPKELMVPAMSPADAATLFGLVVEGGLSFATYYEKLQAGGIASPERTAEQEYADIRADGVGGGEGDDTL